MRSYLGACLILAVGILFSATIAPSWFPLQAPRFLAQLTFLLAVPVGFAVSHVFRWVARILGELSRSSLEVTVSHARYTSGIFIILFFVLALTAPFAQLGLRVLSVRPARADRRCPRLCAATPGWPLSRRSNKSKSWPRLDRSELRRAGNQFLPGLAGKRDYQWSVPRGFAKCVVHASSG